MTFKEFVNKLIKLKQENPEISNCIAENYYLKSIHDKDNNFSPCLFFYLQSEGQLKLMSVYDLSNYTDREVKEINYSQELGHNIVFIEGKVTDDIED